MAGSSIGIGAGGGLSLSFRLTGADEAQAAILRIAEQLGGKHSAVLEVTDRSHDILFAQKEQKRNVISWTAEEAQSGLNIANVHLAKARDANSTAADGEARAEAMWKELGEYYRDRIAAKINDRVNVPKARLSDGYKAYKDKRWGAGKPILVASGALLEDVKNAPVKVIK